MDGFAHAEGGVSRESPVPDRPATVTPGLLLIFPVSLAVAGAVPPGVFGPLPAEHVAAHDAAFVAAEEHLLGRPFRERGRIARRLLGRLALPGDDPDAPAWADIALVTHSAGVGLWQAWLPAPAQPFDASRWLAWLDAEAPAGLAPRVWTALAAAGRTLGAKPLWPQLCFPHLILRAPAVPLETLLAQQGEALVRLLFLDRSRLPLKPAVVDATLAGDHCARQGGLTLLGRRAALDVLAAGRDAAYPDQPGLPPQPALPFIVTIETLLLERAALGGLHDRLLGAAPRSVEELLSLKREVLGALEEYYGAGFAGSRFIDSVTEAGEVLLGITDLFDALMDRLEAVSFEITTRYQNRMTLLQFWLTIVFGATEIGFIASGIATWYYRTGLWAVLAWTIGAAVVAGLTLALGLRRWTR